MCPPKDVLKKVFLSFFFTDIFKYLNSYQVCHFTRLLHFFSVSIFMSFYVFLTRPQMVKTYFFCCV